MKILVLCAMFACLTGCIPIGIRGSTLAAVEPVSGVAPPEVQGRLQPESRADGAATSKGPGSARSPDA